MSRHYGIYRVGPKRDRLIARRVLRKSAEKLVRALNRDPAAPLHYCLRDGKG
jgi:hypothetical protein